MQGQRLEIAKIVGIAGAYALTARLGLLLEPVAGFATLVWAPTGISVAAVSILGYRASLGVFAGALAANLLNGAAMSLALGIATGNTLEAVVAVYILRRFRTFEPSFDRVTGVLAFLLVAMLAPVVSASIGVASLFAANVVSRAQVGETWRAWWVGDCIGAMLVAPLLLVWHSMKLKDLSRRNALEAASVAVSLVLVSLIVFFGRTPLEGNWFLGAYLMFPVLIWASVRFTQRGAVTAVFLTSLMAIIGTLRGTGPFRLPELHESLFALQTFMGIVAASFLMLGAAIAERGRAQEALARALDAESTANRSKSAFLAVMSHELRTPLNAIAGYAQLLSMGVQGALTDKQLQAVARIERNQQHLAALIGDVLSLTRGEAGRMSLHRSRVAVRDAVDMLSPFVDPELRRKNIRFEALPMDDSLAVNADPEKLRQILLNLLSNAIKYTAEGGRVEISAQRDDQSVRIAVRDTGIGIPSNQLERVFEPFFQVDHGHTRRYPGAGLGLSISRDLARAMDGEITLDSQVGTGTTACLILPSI